MQLKSNPKVEAVFSNYPDRVSGQMIALRKLILDTVEEMDDVTSLEETLKWGEPSYLTKNGSTLRMDWKAKNPNYYALYFKCTSRLVETFKVVFKETLTFEGNRAVLFKVDEPLPLDEVKKCIQTTLRYHKVKHLDLLGL